MVKFNFILIILFIIFLRPAQFDDNRFKSLGVEYQKILNNSEHVQISYIKSGTITNKIPRIGGIHHIDFINGFNASGSPQNFNSGSGFYRAKEIWFWELK